ncbi:LEA type 2 family protein, partial [candidate division WOR-3 bacterium]|nr:LEA type 2 family protein [candidate division WOR-3 bacterium]
MKKFLLAALLASVLGGCFILRRTQLQNCEFRLAGTSIKEIALTYLRLAINIDVTNPNRIDVVLDRMRFDLYVNDEHVANGVSNLKTRIPSGGSVKISPVVTLDYAQVGTAIISTIKN